MRAFTRPASALRQLFAERLPTTLALTMPTPYLLILLPVALLGLTDRRRWVFWLMSWCFLVAAGLFYIFLDHYTIAAAPAVIFTVVLSIKVIRLALPKAGVATVFVPAAVLLLAIESIAINRQDIYEPIPATGSSPGWVSRFNFRQIPDTVRKPALVFFRFSPKEGTWEEPVYNWDVLNPDDAPVIRAHDLGAKRDVALLQYYQRKRSELSVYVFDRAQLKLQTLGNLDSAIASMRAAAGTTP
jgi:NADH:ubiquinone oxidoreductase subunit K